MQNTGIEWCDDTDNPIRVKGGGFYCVKCSPGCKFCYAETVNNRFFHDTHVDYKKLLKYPELELREDIVDGWKNKKKRRRIFVSSMTDVFGEFVSTKMIRYILDGMIEADQHIFLLLTKRSVRMKAVISDYCRSRGIDRLPMHIYCMVSVENQEYANERIFDLCTTQCSSRALSIEPLLGGVELTDLVHGGVMWNCLNGVFDLPEIPHPNILGAIDWVIVGGESGTKARPMNPNWVRTIKYECANHNVPFLFKQWGEYAEYEHVDPTMDIIEYGRGGKGYQHLLINDAGETGVDARELKGTQAILYRFGRSLCGNTLDGYQYKEVTKDMQEIIDSNKK